MCIVIEPANGKKTAHLQAKGHRWQVANQIFTLLRNLNSKAKLRKTIMTLNVCICVLRSMYIVRLQTK